MRNEITCFFLAGLVLHVPFRSLYGESCIYFVKLFRPSERSMWLQDLFSGIAKVCARTMTLSETCIHPTYIKLRQISLMLQPTFRWNDVHYQ